MGSSDELKVMLRAIQEGWLPPDSLSRLSKEWLESGAPSILRFLVEKGCLSDEQIKSLETAINLNSSLSSNQEKTSVFPGNTPHSPIKTDEDAGTPHSGSHHSTQAVPHFGPHGWVDSPLSQDRFSRKRFFRKGGPGQIWLVWDNALGRDVIVKTIRPELARKPAMLTRFLREARLTSQLEHPNIVPVYDLMGDDQNRDSCAYSMRYVNGPTLAEAVEKYHTRLARGEAGYLDLVKLLDSFILLCRAVAYAHSRHIIHRDLKGQNVILGDFGEVILLDWGLAKRVGDQDPEQTVDFGILNSLETEPITQPGSINGTPGFMSPEVARGEPASFLSDVYSLGAVLYTICCGRPPYRGSSALETLEKVKEGPPPPPSRVLPHIPRALEAITLKAIHRRPDQRYPSAEALAEDLRRWLADEPILAISDPVSVKVLRWAKKNRTQVQMVAGVLATALVGLVIGATLLWREKEQTEKQKVVAVANYQLARDLSQSSIGLMEKTEAYYTSNEELSRSRKTILDSTVNAYRSFLAQEPENNDLLRATANVLRYAANAHRLDDEFDQSRSMYTEAVAHLETVANALPGDVGVHSALAQTLRDWAVANQSQGELEASRGLFQQSIEVYRRCLPLTKARSGINRGMGLCRYELGEIHFGLGDYATSLELQKQAAETFGQLLDQSEGQSGRPYDRLLRAACIHRAAKSQLALGQKKEAWASVEKALGYLEADFGKRSTWDELTIRGVSRLDLLNHYILFKEAQAETGLASGSLDDAALESLWKAIVAETRDIEAAFKERPIYTLRVAQALHGFGTYLKTRGKEKEAKAQWEEALKKLDSPALSREKRVSYSLEAARVYLDLSELERSKNEAASIDLLEKAMGHLSRVREKCPNHADLKKLEGRK